MSNINFWFHDLKRSRLYRRIGRKMAKRIARHHARTIGKVSV